MANNPGNANYNPEIGDIFEWSDEQYLCIENNGSSGVVNPIGETYYIRNFVWRYGYEVPTFIRKAVWSEELNMYCVLPNPPKQ